MKTKQLLSVLGKVFHFLAPSNMLPFVIFFEEVDE